MANRIWEVRLTVPAASAREAVEELGGRSLAWLDDVVSTVQLVDTGHEASNTDPSFDPADHPLAVRL